MDYTIDTLEAEIRSTLQEDGIGLTYDQILVSINDAYREVASRTLCIERADSAQSIQGCRFIPFSGHNVSCVELSSPFRTLLPISPSVVGHMALNDNYPAYWFKWGNYIAIEPTPDAVYNFVFYVSDYPVDEVRRQLVIYQDTDDVEMQDLDLYWQKEEHVDSPYELPFEFHPCVLFFCLYVLSIKLQQWYRASQFYNSYINSMAFRKQEYIKRKREERRHTHYPDIIRRTI